MLRLTPSEVAHLSKFVTMESVADNSQFIISSSLSTHQSQFADTNVRYLTIYLGNEIAGFMILAVEPELKSVEFRRIVVAKKGLGIGQEAINQMEKYVLEELRISRVWLDVFEDNLRAQHIYQKLGYQQFDTMPYDNKILLLFEKHLH
ncbi:GNAT family N-acetyltransferase [Pseudoalteromonas sp. S2755]|uniref:GNAT family N-acetyltransferase n=1 Tax=Pseudoalteromonas sp. S2755 TaxID=2066523 RepID=UPI00110A68B0|nr:GNAT family N-acetyltransferase [Pseudoalteromonas sp. S2755]TMN39323.1 histone acetyltransferase [Pseudoalteromonas sp. S2755]